MSLEKIEALEVRVRKLVDLVVELRADKASLEDELQVARERLVKQDELTQGWEEERTSIRSRIEKVLGELEFLDNTSHHQEG
ncbi:MAG: cell division protein ZapB [Nitrospirales bacterium]|nr:cell division protein ZapB [Nitrospira sp.]MDR4500486.1 cell division protein ZapB [Nitrospirales bacterium]